MDVDMDEELKDSLLKLAASMDALADSLREDPSEKLASTQVFDIGKVGVPSSGGPDPLTDFLLS